MNIYVLDINMNMCDVIDDYISVIWASRYFTSGDFELYMHATEKNIATLRRDRYLCREQDIIDNTYNNVMIIQNIEITTDVENGNFLIVKGKSLKSLVGRRIVWEQINVVGTMGQCISRVIDDNIIDPYLTSRRINNFVLSDDILNFSDAMSIQLLGDNIEEWLEKICTSYGIGWDVFIRDKKLVFYLWEGKDRSYNQNELPYVVFSSEFDNILSSNYKMSMENYKNVALVVGEGEGLNRKTTTVGIFPGLYRYELFVDAKDVSTNEGEISDDEYDAILQEKGLEAMAETTMIESFEGTIEPNMNYILNEDYFLGDIVQIIDEHGKSAAVRIAEIIDSEDESGRTIIPTYII